MTAKRIDGKAAALALRDSESPPRLPLSGNVPDAPPASPWCSSAKTRPSAVYVRSKEKAAHEAGMESFEHRLPAYASQENCSRWSMSSTPTRRSTASSSSCRCRRRSTSAVVITRISPDKDVDGFHPVNAGRLAIGLNGFVPCTPLGCLMLLQARARRSLRHGSGGHRPLEYRRQADGAAAARAELHGDDRPFSRTRDLPAVVRRADIVVAAVGRAQMVTGDWLKPGATVIDVGINRTERQGLSATSISTGRRGGGRDHACARRRRPDDHRLPDPQHLRRRPRAAKASTMRKAYDHRFASRTRSCRSRAGNDRNRRRACLRARCPGGSASGPHFANGPIATR